MNIISEQLFKRQQLDEERLQKSIGMMDDSLSERDTRRKYLDVSRNSMNGNCIEAILTTFGMVMPTIPDTLKDLNEQLDYAIRSKGIFWRDVKLDDGWQKKAIGVMLSKSRTDGRPLVLLPNGAGSYKLYDPDLQHTEKLTKEKLADIDNNAQLFYRPLPAKKMTSRDLITFMLQMLDKSDYVRLILASAVLTAVGMLPAFANRILFKNLEYGGSHYLLILLLLLGVSISRFCFTAIKLLVVNRIKTKISVPTEAAMTARVISLPMSFFEGTTSGEMSNWLNTVPQMCETMVTSILGVGFTGLFSLAYIGQIFVLGPSLVIPAVIILVFNTAVSLLAASATQRAVLKQMTTANATMGIQVQLLGGIRKFKLACAEKRAYAKWAEVYSSEISAKYDLPFLAKYANTLATAVSLLGTILIYYVATISSMDSASYMAFSVSFGELTGIVSAISAISMALSNIRPQLKIITPILQTVPEDAGDKKIVNHLNGEIELNSVSFRYSSHGDRILDNISLKIHPGEYLAIVGRTGCGKTTLTKILLGFIKPEAGSVSFDGTDIGELNLCSLRRNIGMVSQDGRLLGSSIMSNIALASPMISEKEAWEAAEMADIAEDIRAMPMGMHTRVTEDGSVSGGQRQRILIARALAAKPSILILDEGTSALDNISQKHVCDALNKLDCTRIVIAHRLSTIRQCDRIIMLEKGHIVEDGTYDQLIDKNGKFYELVKRQQLDH